jgi:hypothetical protein
VQGEPAEAGEARGDEQVVGRLLEGVVEVDVGAQERVEVLRRRSRAHGARAGDDLLALAGVAALGGEARGQAVQAAADLVDVDDPAAVEVQDAYAAPRHDDHQVLAGQQLERVAHRGAAGPELGGQLVLAQPGSRWDPLGDDGLGQHLGDLLAEGLGAQVLG